MTMRSGFVQEITELGCSFLRSWLSSLELLTEKTSTKSFRKFRSADDGN